MSWLPFPGPSTHYTTYRPRKGWFNTLNMIIMHEKGALRSIDLTARNKHTWTVLHRIRKRGGGHGAEALTESFSQDSQLLVSFAEVGKQTRRIAILESVQKYHNLLHVEEPDIWFYTDFSTDL